MKMKQIILKCEKIFASCALLIGVISTSATCRYVLHQPEVPEDMKKIIEK